ncbi:MAG: ABC transporter ATP-binding protein [Christensenellales bacterium]|jgi:ATP-binding cassette subfamily B protein|nr:ABC transporter ATP-binding protein [Clostridiales bacterium]
MAEARQIRHHSRKERQHKPGMGRGPMHGMVMEKPKDFKGSFKKLINYLKPQLPFLIMVIVLAALGTILYIIAPRITANAINALQNGIMRGKLDMEYIIKTLIIVAAIYVLSSLLNFLSYFLSAGVSQRVVYRMRKDVKEKFKKLPIEYYDTHSSGNILSVVTNDIETISLTLQQSISQAINSALSIVGILIMMLTISGYMTLIAVGSLPLFLIITMVIAKKSQKKFVKQQAKLGQLNGYVEEMYSNKMVVQLYNKEKRAAQNFEEINEELYDAGKNAQFLSGIIMPMLQFVNNLSYVAISVVGGILAGGRLMIGDIQAFMQYSHQFGQPIMQTANIINIIQSTVAAAQRLFDLLESQEEPQDVAQPADISKVKGEVVFEGVDFSYDKNTELLKDINFKVESGGVIAIVGPTGAGKTTLVNLLMRFYEIDKGRITIDGIDIRNMAKKDLRSLFGMVLQDTWLESGSLMENIAYAKPNGDLEDVKKAAEKAHIDHFIDTLPQGYHTLINEDVTNISQGEKQLITIARAIYADPKILILDEATSSVDTRTESYIQNAMTAMMKGKTSFIIAHRLSTIRKAGLILVMDKGKIVEQGNHEELLNKKGFYYNLYNSQFNAQNI